MTNEELKDCLLNRKSVIYNDKRYELMAIRYSVDTNNKLVVSGEIYDGHNSISIVKGKDLYVDNRT